MDEHIIIYFFIFIVGACIGSFLNVVALRALSKESIVFPSSKCPKCNTPIKWYDNIPILSYFLTFKGKCRSCGEKVSIQYPIVETITAILYTIIFMVFGLKLQTLLLLILLSISIVIVITDIKEEAVYDAHSWIFIITALIYAYTQHDIYFALTGFIGAALIMELIARGTYYLIRKKQDDENKTEIKEENTAENVNQNKEEEKNEEFDINKYVQEYKRAFGEGDTYLAAGAGALLGIKYFIVAVAAAIILQALCILPQFLIKLYKQQEKHLLISISSFAILAIIYFILSNLFSLNIFVVILLLIPMIFFAIDAITRLKKTTTKEGFSSLPFGPALLFATYLVLFFTPQIMAIIKYFIVLE